MARALCIGFFVAAGMICGACSDSGDDETFVLVDVRTDYRPGLEFERIEIVLIEAGTTAELTSTASASPGERFIDGVRVAEFRDLAAGRTTVRGRLLDGSGAVVAERTVVFDLMTTRGVTVTLTRSCEATMCPGDNPSETECVGARCVPVECVEGAVESCGPPICSSDGDCPATGCLRAACAEGACLSFADDAACASGERCQQDGTCMPPPVDAGPRACEMDNQCDDGVACTEGRCREGVCEFDSSAAGTDCDDGLWCTPDDTCNDVGVCVGTGVRCDDGDTCTTDSCDENADSCVAEDACVAPQWCTSVGCRASRRVFVTSSTTAGDFGGLSAADGICQGLAGVAGIEGTYLAWLADPSGDPATRMTRAAEGYALVDGTLVAMDFSQLISTDLATMTLLSPIKLDETGTDVGCGSVWTATAPDGSGTTNHCGGWTGGSTGGAGRNCEVTSEWTRSISTGCNMEFRLYCLEQ